MFSTFKRGDDDNDDNETQNFVFIDQLFVFDVNVLFIMFLNTFKNFIYDLHNVIFVLIDLTKIKTKTKTKQKQKNKTATTTTIRVLKLLLSL